MSQSDAYMELSDPDVWGETHDEQFGMGDRALGAFEIASFKFDVSAEDEDKKKKDDAPKHGHGKVASGTKEATKGKFSISKYIDKGSPDLFLACCKKTEIAWAIISVRESGETATRKIRRKPYLVLEFRNLHVTSFSWEMNPGDTEAAASMESVSFDYESVLIKYSRQDLAGAHQVVKMKGWNFVDHTKDVHEIDPRLGAGHEDDDVSGMS
jgi:type VI secretion system Hcp family effector